MDAIAMYTAVLGPAKKSGKWIAFRCPWCDTKPGDRHFRVNPQNGNYVCMRCRNDMSGRAHGVPRKFADLMGVDSSEITYVKREDDVEPEVYEQMVAEIVYEYAFANSILTDEHAQYLKNRGIRNPSTPPANLRSTDTLIDKLQEHFDEDALLASGLFGVDDKTQELRPAAAIWENRILIPYFRDNHVTFLRSRSVDGPPRFKYLSPIGAPQNQALWLPPKLRARRLVVTEGELKAISSCQVGVACVALPGMNSAHATFASYCRESCVESVVICFDTQVDHQNYVDAAARTLKRKLVDACPDIRVHRANLPLMDEIDGGQKCDIDSYIHWFGREAYLKVLGQALPM